MKYFLCFVVLMIAMSCDVPLAASEDNRFTVFPSPALATVSAYVNNKGATFTLIGYNNHGKEILHVTTSDGKARYTLPVTEPGTYRLTLDMNNVKGTKSIYYFGQ
jgi:hypothetical protein